MNAHAGDFLDPNRSVTVKFTVASREGEALAVVTATFQSDGLQMLAPGGYVSVNGVALTPAALSKQGFWYKSQVSRNPQYVLEYSLGAGKPVVRRTVLDRQFVPVLPDSVSRGRGLVVPFVGAPLQPGESIFAELVGGGDGPGRWGRVLRAAVTDNRITFNAKTLAAANLGEAKLYVGVVARESSPAGDYGSVHTSGVERSVRVTD